MYLKAKTNNRSETVLQHFLSACDCFGVPSRVRADKGGKYLHVYTFGKGRIRQKHGNVNIGLGENRDVARWMVHNRGINRGSCIIGRSVHNVSSGRIRR